MAPHPPFNPRSLCWTYSRASERQHCELSLDHGWHLYEFHIRVREGAPRGTVERYVFASSAIERHCEYEAQLIASGYSLEHFEVVLR